MKSSWVEGILVGIIGGVAVWWITEGPSLWSVQTNHDISGQYYGTVGADVPVPNRTIRAHSSVMVNIRSGSGGTFKGDLTSIETTGPGAGSTIPLEGKMMGDKITFEMRASNEQDYVSFEGEATGNCIKGIYRAIGPETTRIMGEMRRRGIPDPPPGKFELCK